MSMEAQQSYSLGKTAANGELEHLLGQRARFQDINYASTEAVKPRLSHIPIEAVWVKNESGGVLDAGDVVYWATSSEGPGKGVAGVATAAGSHIPAGFVDPYVGSSGVADDANFWLIVKGPCKAKFTTSQDWTMGDMIIPGASGRCTEGTEGTTSDSLMAGVSLVTDSTSTNDALVRVLATTKF